MAGRHRTSKAAMWTAQVAVRLPPALKDHLTDAAAEHGRSFNEELVDRLMQPRSRSEILTNAYEGYNSVETLLLRTEPEDAGARIELWRALRDVSRDWTAHELGMSERMLRAWERSVELSREEELVIQKQLDAIDQRHPQFKTMAEHRLAEAQARIATRKKQIPDQDVELDWLPGSSDYD